MLQGALLALDVSDSEPTKKLIVTRVFIVVDGNRLSLFVCLHCCAGGEAEREKRGGGKKGAGLFLGLSLSKRGDHDRKQIIKLAW